VIKVGYIAACLTVLAGCSSAPTSNSGAGVRGTVDDQVAEDYSIGVDEASARGSLNGKPLVRLDREETACELYRGIRRSGGLPPEATGRLWLVCFSEGHILSASSDCPNAWRPGEYTRYVHAGYSANPQDCRQ
jgi:hypothetical protein